MLVCLLLYIGQQKIIFKNPFPRISGIILHSYLYLLSVHKPFGASSKRQVVFKGAFLRISGLYNCSQFSVSVICTQAFWSKLKALQLPVFLYINTASFQSTFIKQNIMQQTNQIEPGKNSALLIWCFWMGKRNETLNRSISLIQ